LNDRKQRRGERKVSRMGMKGFSSPMMKQYSCSACGQRFFRLIDPQVMCPLYLFLYCDICINKMARDDVIAQVSRIAKEEEKKNAN
jgi:DNA-directed RNA polymerase subunit RPC12/RpoP